MTLIAFITGCILGWLIKFFRDYGLRQQKESLERAVKVLDHHLSALMQEHMRVLRKWKETPAGRVDVPPDVPCDVAQPGDRYWDMGGSGAIDIKS